MNIIQSILTNNPCYKAGRTITVQGLMLHSVGCCQPDAKVFVKNWNNSSYDRACVHAFIDGNTGDVYQTLPWNHRGWHAGGSSNSTHIGVEMCEPATIKYTGGANFTVKNETDAKAVATRTYKSAVELFAKLCNDYNLDPLGKDVIISHSEGHAKGIASNHADPEHLWKQLKLPYTMDGFRADVKKAMATKSETDNTIKSETGSTIKNEIDNTIKTETINDKRVFYRVQVGAFTNRQYAANMLDKLKKAGFDGFITKVEVTSKDD